MAVERTGPLEWLDLTLRVENATSEKYDEVSRTKLLDPVGVGLGRKIVWSHPAYADRCVFARNDQEIVCASLAAP